MKHLDFWQIRRTEVLHALGMLIHGAAAECLPYFRLLLMKFLKNLDVGHLNGLGFCLKALTLRLGTSISDIAEELMHFYMTHLDDDMLIAAGALVTTLGGKLFSMEHFWDALVLSLEPSPHHEAHILIVDGRW